MRASVIFSIPQISQSGICHHYEVLITIPLLTRLTGPPTATSECRLQQSLSTPCPQEDQTSRKDSEYRRFKSEGSSAGALPAGPEMEVAIDDLSPIADASSTSPHRFNLIAVSKLDISEKIL
ncbi:hypothetical protein TELCIR_15195 [Teladorsagia circumcincta]|uniref:Uncharacterized protein n=1 Tax=Teladorsagia circumcincta TaxID=45464 RepID=A0A2G9TZ60_TELCI|nr:hypothetical protein TELCIR_15195 [Teladorsagia circumcincta]